jgi:hypothetical protein
VDEDKEARKLQRARLVLAGHTFVDDDDPFEGLTPQVTRLVSALKVFLDSQAQLSFFLT